MRRVVFALILVSHSGWSQPPRQQAQAPIVVKVEIPPAAHRDWIDLLGAFGPLIAVVVALIVGFSQWSLQKRQWEQSLYSMRHRVYRSVIRYWRVLVETKGAPPLSARQRFLATLSHAPFLFGPEVGQFLEAYYEVTTRYCNAFEQWQRSDEAARSPMPPPQPDYIDAVQKELASFAGLKNAKIFSPYLQLQRPPLYVRAKTALNRRPSGLHDE